MPGAIVVGVVPAAKTPSNVSSIVANMAVCVRFLLQYTATCSILLVFSTNGCFFGLPVSPNIVVAIIIITANDLKSSLS